MIPEAQGPDALACYLDHALEPVLQPSWVEEAILAQRELTLPACRALVAGGVSFGTISALNFDYCLALGSVALAGDGRAFEFNGPDRRLLLGVRDAAGTMIDIVALSSGCEDEWALLTGAGDLLGEQALEQAEAQATVYDRRVAVRLYATPMAWLRGGASGVCVLDWNRSTIARLRGLPGPTAGRSGQVMLMTDLGAGERLKAMLTHGGLPLVAEDRGIGRMAA